MGISVAQMAPLSGGPKEPACNTLAHNPVKPTCALLRSVPYLLLPGPKTHTGYNSDEKAKVEMTPKLDPQISAKANKCLCPSDKEK